MPRDPHLRPLDDRVRCQHMLEAAEQACMFAENRSRAALGTDAMLTRALVHAIQEIGEAASKVSDAGRARAPEVPWPKIVGMRHRLVHDYFEINHDLVWAVVERDLPLLIAALNKAFATWPLPIQAIDGTAPPDTGEGS